MTVFQCGCGYTCGTKEAYLRHATRFHGADNNAAAAKEESLGPPPVRSPRRTPVTVQNQEVSSVSDVLYTPPHPYSRLPERSPHKGGMDEDICKVSVAERRRAIEANCSSAGEALRFSYRRPATAHPRVWPPGPSSSSSSFSPAAVTASAPSSAAATGSPAWIRPTPSAKVMSSGSASWAPPVSKAPASWATPAAAVPTINHHNRNDAAPLRAAWQQRQPRHAQAPSVMAIGEALRAPLLHEGTTSHQQQQQLQPSWRQQLRCASMTRSASSCDLKSARSAAVEPPMPAATTATEGREDSRAPGLPLWPPPVPQRTAFSSVSSPPKAAGKIARNSPTKSESDFSEMDEDGGVSSSSRSPCKNPDSPCKSPHRNQDSSEINGLRRCRRQSSGLVFNPGSATVDMVKSSRGSKTECRFSFSRGEGGEQRLLKLTEELDQPRQDSERSLHSSRLSYRSTTAMPATSEWPPSGRSSSSVVGAAAPQEANSLGNPVAEGAASSARCPVIAAAMSDELASESAAEIFTHFMAADGIASTLDTFEELLRRCASGGHNQDLPYLRIQKLCGGGLPYQKRQVWSLLDTRMKRCPEYSERCPAYGGTGALRGTRAVICGAGPCGLRAALECALLRAEVTVVEKRGLADAFNRINRVHLWEWAKQDLIAWGAKNFDPPGGSFGGDNDYCHIGIAELQLLLLKNALLLGVNFHFGLEAKHLSSEGRLVCGDGRELPCDSLFLADGANSPLSRTLGLRSVSQRCGKGSAIGVVANFVNSRDAEQMALRQFSWARQFNQKLFADIEEKTSINLENVVYYKAQSHHYMVMTPTKRSLLAAGVLKDERPTGRLLHGSNVDFQELCTMVKKIAGFFKLPTELCESQGTMIFDFSGVKRLENAATAIGGVFACAVGDALLEPFWPEGLGIIRGFMSALDAASAACVAREGRREEAVAQVSGTYNILKSVAAHTAGQCLQKDIRQFKLEPKSRYNFNSTI